MQQSTAYVQTIVSIDKKRQRPAQINQQDRQDDSGPTDRRGHFCNHIFCTKIQLIQFFTLVS